MPRKVKDLIKDLEKHGFTYKPGKGSHRKFTHPKCPKPVVISGQLGSDALPYQEKEIREAMEQVAKDSQEKNDRFTNKSKRRKS